MKKIFTNLFLLATLFLASTNLTAQTYDNGTWYSLYDATEHYFGNLTGSSDDTFSVFAPTTGNLSFQWKKTGKFIKYPIFNLTISESSDGSNYTSKYTLKSGSDTKQDSYVTVTTTVSKDITHLKFQQSGGTLKRYYKDIKLPLAKHILLNDGTSFGTTSVERTFTDSVTINETSAEVVTIKLRSFLTAGDITITSDNTAFSVAKTKYSVGNNACASANGTAGSEAGGGTLGNINNYDVLIYFHPTSAGPHSGTITLTDGTSTATIKVSGICKKRAQTITWNDDIANIKTTDNITLNATATTAISYTSSDNSIAEIVGNTLKINKHGKVTITATAAETDIYAPASQTKEVTISATVPEVTSWPQVAPLTYGTPLTLDMLVGGNANVPGNFECAELPTTLNAGTHNLIVRFVPEDQNIYATVENTISVVVNKADQTIAWDFTTTEMTVDETLTLNANATAGEVTFDLTGDAATLEGNTLTAVKAGEVTITASQAGNDNYNAAEEVAHTITIHKATPTITAWPTLNDVVYGATYGEALQLIGGEASVEGAFSITNMPADLAQVPAVGEYTFGIVFTPAKAESYNEVSDSVTLQVTKQLQTIAWDFADQELLIGNTLTLSATAPAGEVSFAIQPAEGVASLEGNTLTALAAGTVTITATAPENENYEAATVSYTVTVIKHTPKIITLPTVAPLGHGTALTDDMLNGGESNIEGTWSFVNPTQSLNMGNNEVAIRFTPTNTNLYNTIDATITIVVEKAETIIYWEPEATTIVLGTVINLPELSASNGEYPIFAITGPEGVLEYDDEWLTLTAVGVGTTTVTASVSETNTHKAAVREYLFTVVGDEQSIKWDIPETNNIFTTDNITFDAEAETNITYTSSNTEVADIENNKLIIKTAGTVTITANAEETNKYKAATAQKTFNIFKATPAIVSLPTVEAITYGATLEAATLNGGETDTEGTWQWNADLTQVLNAGTHELAVQFIPTNTAWYNTLDSKVTVTVNKADQTIAWDFTTTEMTVDDVLTLSATATAGEVTFTITGDAATLEGNTLTAVKAGEVTITASQAGNDNYNAAEEVAHTITIHKATPTITAWPTLNDVVYGATYGEALQLIGGEASVEGAFSITNMPADLAQVPAVGEYTFGIVFTPAKAESYNEVSDSVTLQVTKQLQTIAWDFADQELLIGNTLTLSATAPAGEVSFAIQPAEGVASLEGNTLTALAAGTVTITATAPENENYEAASVSYTVTIIKHTPEIITLPTVAPLGHGTALTDDMLNGGESNIEGTWSFVNPDQELQMGDNEVAIRFTPTNTDLYNTIDATIIIVVEKAETIIYWEPEATTIVLGTVINLPELSASNGEYPIFAITGPEGVLEYDDEWLTLTAVGVGTTTVTASVSETNTHKAAVLSYEITVFDPNSETTGITNTTITGKDTEKVFINGQLFIIRNNQWYDTTGKLVK